MIKHCLLAESDSFGMLQSIGRYIVILENEKWQHLQNLIKLEWYCSMSLFI